jgi:hypothetical protein
VVSSPCGQLPSARSLAGPNEVAMGEDAGKSLLAVFLIGEADHILESRSISTYKSARFLKIKSLIMRKTIESISSTFDYGSKRRLP